MRDIRKQILDAFAKYGDSSTGSPTWWFKFDTHYTTSQIRKELYRMRAEGLVEKTDKSRVGQAHWRLLSEG